MNIGILISTCHHYFPNIFNIINDLESCNVSKDNILIVSGQELHDETCVVKGVQIVKVTYTGLHLTGVIHLYENANQYNHIDYWVTLPDTIKINRMFYENIQLFLSNAISINRCKNNHTYSIPFINPNIRQTMDMGIISKEHIINMGDYISKIKLTTWDNTSVQNLKRQLIFDENLILGCVASWKSHEYVTKFKYLDPNFSQSLVDLFFINDLSNIVENKTFANGKSINENFLVPLDLIKYQRNFTGPFSKFVMEL